MGSVLKSRGRDGAENNNTKPGATHNTRHVNDVRHVQNGEYENQMRFPTTHNTDL